MASWGFTFVFLVALLAAHQAAARVLPGDDALTDQKNFASFGSAGGYSGIGNGGIPFGGFGAGVGGGGGFGGINGFGGVAGGIETLPAGGGFGGVGNLDGGDAVKIYILDVTDIWTKADESSGVRDRHHCLVEYDVESCVVGGANDRCTHTRTLTVSLPTGGDVRVGHQHAGGVGSTLYGEGGREVCPSSPIYGTGDERGNEVGYIVGMSTCYPSPGSL